MRKFIVLYTAREGSTALVEAINRRPNVNVPIMEHVDKWWLSKHEVDVAWLDAMERVLETGELQHGPARALKHLREHWSPRDQIDGFGFKWRPFGKPAEVARKLSAHDVTTILLHRDLLDATASIYVSARQRKGLGDGAVGAGHFQFRFARMTEEERQLARARLDGMSVPLNPVHFYAIMGLRLWREMQKTYYFRMAHRAGLPTGVLDYAEVERSMEDAVDRVLEMAAIPLQPTGEARPLRFQKASSRPASEKIRHYWIVRWNPLTWLLAGIDRALVRHARRLERRPQPPRPRSVEALG